MNGSRWTVAKCRTTSIKDIDLFSFAGIYSVWKDGEGVPLYSFSMLTTAPNKDMAPIHNRMPVILQPDQEAIWLDPSYREPGPLAQLLVPYEDGELDIYQVSKAVSSPRVNEPELIQPVRS